MKRMVTTIFLLLPLGLMACGPNMVTRATSGAVAGAVAAGPIGAGAGAILGGSGTVRVQ